MKLVFSTLTLLFTLFSPALGANKTVEVTVFCDDAYRPYSYSSQAGEPKGIYTLILEEAFQKMKGYQVTIRPRPWTRAMKSLEAGEVFAVYPPYHRPQDRPFITDYSQPILDETIVVYTRDEKDLVRRSKWPEDWYGKTIGLFTGTMDIGGPRFVAAVKEGKIKVIEAKDNEANLRNLITRKVDAYVNDRIAISYTLRHLDKLKEWPETAPKLVEAAIVSSEQGYLAFAKDNTAYPYKNDFIQQLNKVLTEMKSSGRINKIVQDYIK